MSLFNPLSPLLYVRASFHADGAVGRKRHGVLLGERGGRGGVQGGAD